MSQKDTCIVSAREREIEGERERETEREKIACVTVSKSRVVFPNKVLKPQTYIKITH